MKNSINNFKRMVFALVISLFVIQLQSCKKDFLEKKSDQKLLVPTTLQDFQALLDNNSVMNIAPVLQIISADDFYTDNLGWQNLPNDQKDIYSWLPTISGGNGAAKDEWNIPYKTVFYANIVLDGLEKLNSNSDRNSYDNVKGSALFFRALALGYLVDGFCKPYIEASASTDMGIPMPLTSDVNDRPGRGTLKQVYNQIIKDLKEAIALLPNEVLFKTRPSNPAANALLAKIYLTMEDYENAGLYADASLKKNDKLINFNDFLATASRPFPSDYPNGVGNPEVLFYASFVNYRYFTSSGTTTYLNDVLYKSYVSNDLRKNRFFSINVKELAIFKGSYSGSQTYTQFAGLTTSENYLIRAECYARKGKVTEALKDLNTLLVNRWLDNSYSNVVVTDKNDALNIILKERRKELVGRGNRWADLRRLNKDPRFAVTLKREINGQEYNLPPNDNRYVFPIPFEEISISGILQNVR